MYTYGYMFWQTTLQHQPIVAIKQIIRIVPPPSHPSFSALKIRIILCVYRSG